MGLLDFVVERFAEASEPLLKIVGIQPQQGNKQKQVVVVKDRVVRVHKRSFP